jgi:hypothetical protein
MPILDHCIGSIYEPGNIGASSGLPPVAPSVPSLIDPDDYNPETLTYSWDFSKFYNSMYGGTI